MALASAMIASARSAAQPFAPMTGLHVEPLHFANAVAQVPDGHAANGLFVFDGQEQSPVRRSIFAWEPVKLLLKVLEREVNAQEIGVLDEQLASGNNVGVGLGGDDGHFEG